MMKRYVKLDADTKLNLIRTYVNSIRFRTRLAVSGFVCQIGSRTRRTNVVFTSATDTLPSSGAQYV